MPRKSRLATDNLQYGFAIKVQPVIARLFFGNCKLLEQKWVSISTYVGCQ